MSARRRLVGLGVTAALVGVVLAAPASAATPPRVVLHTAGPMKGRISLVVERAHRDASPQADSVDVRLTLRDRNRRVIGGGVDHFPLRDADARRTTVSHRVVLDAAASRRARRAAASGRLRVDVATSVADAPVVRSTHPGLRLSSSSLPPLQSCYTVHGGFPETVLYVNQDVIDHLVSLTGRWQPTTGPIVNGKNGEWGSTGTWTQQSSGPSVPGVVSGTFSLDGARVLVSWPAVVWPDAPPCPRGSTSSSSGARPQPRRRFVTHSSQTGAAL